MVCEKLDVETTYESLLQKHGDSYPGFHALPTIVHGVNRIAQIQTYIHVKSREREKLNARVRADICMDSYWILRSA